MAKVKIEEVIDHLDYGMRRALEATISEHYPGVGINSHALLRTFKKMVRRKCNEWETVPDNLVQRD